MTTSKRKTTTSQNPATITIITKYQRTRDGSRKKALEDRTNFQTCEGNNYNSMVRKESSKYPASLMTTECLPQDDDHRLHSKSIEKTSKNDDRSCSRVDNPQVRLRETRRTDHSYEKAKEAKYLHRAPSLSLQCDEEVFGVTAEELFDDEPSIPELQPSATRTLMCSESLLASESPAKSSVVKVPLRSGPPPGLPPRSTASVVHTNKRVFFEDLPEEIILLIMRHINCSYKDFLGLRLVCKHWASLIRDRSLQDKYSESDTVFLFMLSNEVKHHQKINDYLGIATDLTRDMRAILIDWLVDVVSEFRMEKETLFLAVFYIDRYLAQDVTSIGRGKLQLLGVTCLLIAAKYDEIYAPPVEDLVYICDGAYTADEILSMEISVLNVLKFDITVCTSKQFLDHFMKSAATKLLGDKPAGEVTKVNHFAHYLAELSLLDYKFCLYRPSLVATAVAYLALLGIEVVGSQFFETESPHAIDEVRLCMQDLYELHQRASTLPLRSVTNKFSQPDFGCVSKIVLPALNFDDSE